MEIKLYKPENPVLRKYIECFYTLKRDSTEKSVKYTAFPSVFTMVCLNANAKTKKKGNVRTYDYQRNDRIETSLICNFGSHDQIRYRGQADEIVIYFKPLGINAFLENDLREYLPSLFTAFAPFENYQTAMREIFAPADDAERIHSLENYWLSKYKDFEHPFLQSAVDEIMGSDAAFSIAEFARRQGISRTTLVKHFDRHIGTTPSQFKKIARFRNAMRRQREKFSSENLTEISTEANYFDQSHMVKDFKTLTKYAPKDFFSKISKIENGQINWLFL